MYVYCVAVLCVCVVFFVFKQKTAYEMRISDWSSDVCSSDLLSHTLTRDDGVALEDPCFLSAMHTVRVAGYRPIPVPVDDEGMTVAGLRAALDSGARAVLCTPRAQNPTGVSLSPRRAEDLRAVLAENPYGLVPEDDHYASLERQGVVEGKGVSVSLE